VSLCVVGLSGFNQGAGEDRFQNGGSAVSTPEYAYLDTFCLEF
jgi:hypothetical protein